MSVCSRFARACVLFLAVSTLVGCGGGGGGSGPKRHRVQGKVTYRGEPVKAGEIVFGATDPKVGTSGSAPIKDGAYYFEKGLAEGAYVVVVTAYKRPIQDIPPKELAQIGDSNLAVPKKYTDPKTSNLKYTVTPAAQTKDFELTD